MLRLRCMMIIAASLMLMSLAISAEDMLILPPQEVEPVQEVTDEQLQLFGVSLISIQEIQLDANQKIAEVIEESALSEERLSEILNLQQADPQTFDESVADEELEEFEQTIEKLSEIHIQANEDMVESVESYGFEIEQFNQLAQTIQENPELIQRLQSMFAN